MFFHWMDRSALKTFPVKIFDTFSNLMLMHLSVGITELKESDFVTAKNLQFLNLPKNGITRLTEGVFSRVPKLNRISLSFNQVVDIQDFSFKNLHSLKDLELDGNYITTLTHYTFAGLTNLVDLYLSRNEIETIESGALDLPKLRHLDLADNRLKTMADDLFSNAPELAVLYLDVNYFSEIPKAIWDSPSLLVLSLIDNDLPSVDLVAFARMKKLNYLDLSSTGVKLSNRRPVPSEAESALTEIVLGGNGLTIPNILQHLHAFKKLKIIRLDRNDFTQVDHIEDIKTHLPDIEMIALDSCGNLDCGWMHRIRPVATSLNISLFETDDLVAGKYEDDQLCGVVMAHP